MNAHQRNIVTALLIATFLSAIEVTIVSTAMPVIVDQLGGMELISWVYAVYLLASAVMTPIFGKLSDLYGRKVVFMTGVSIFLIGSMLCGLSQNMGQLIAFRALQGLGAGALMPVTFAIIGDIFNFSQRAKVQGLISSMWGIAGIFGPLVGGFFVDYVSWHWIFYVNLPFGILSMIMVSKHLKENIEKRKRKIDYGGALTFMFGMSLLLYALLAGGAEVAWNSVTMLILLAVSLVFMAIFIRIQLRHEEPLIPMKLLANRNIAVSNISGFLLSGILIGLTAYLPLWVQQVQQMGATSSGLTLVPLSLGWPLGAVISGRLMSRAGTRPLAIIGCTLILIGSIPLALISAATPSWMFIPIMAVIGLGFGVSMTVFTVVVQSAVGASMRGAATSSNSFLRTLGQTIGIAVLGAVLNRTIGSYPDETQVPPQVLASGLHDVFIILTGLAAAGLIVTLWIPQNKGQQEQSVQTKPISEG